MTHTAACQRARTAHPEPSDSVTPDWPVMCRLTVEEQQAVLDCPDGSHDSVRLFTRGKPLVPPWLDVG